MYFLHYGVMSMELRGALFTIIDICNFSLCFMTFYFFLYKASNLMINKERVLRYLRIVCFILLLVMILMATYTFAIYKEYRG